MNDPILMGSGTPYDLQNALLLREAFYGKATPLTTLDFNVVALMVLELSKACAAIVGDPSVSGDKYQKRYETIGVSAETKADADRLRRLRNDYDVAHYSLSSEKRQALEQELSFAFRTAGMVIKEYVVHLEKQHSNSTEST